MSLVKLRLRTYFSPGTEASPSAHRTERVNPWASALSRHPPAIFSNTSAVPPADLRPARTRTGSPQWNVRGGDAAMSEPFLLSEGVGLSTVELLWILAAAFSPSIIAMLLMVFALWLP